LKIRRYITVVDERDGYRLTMADSLIELVNTEQSELLYLLGLEVWFDLLWVNVWDRVVFLIIEMVIVVVVKGNILCLVLDIFIKLTITAVRFMFTAAECAFGRCIFRFFTWNNCLLTYIYKVIKNLTTRLGILYSFFFVGGYYFVR